MVNKPQKQPPGRSGSPPLALTDQPRLEADGKAALDERMDELLRLTKTQSEQIAMLEKIMRYMANENMSMSSHTEETKTLLTVINNQVINLETMINNTLNTMQRREEENQQVLQSFRRHFTDQISQLETRIQGEMNNRASERVARRILPVLDDLELILAEEGTIRQAGSLDAWLATSRSLRSKLLASLASIGMEVLPVVEGETRFDSTLHEAVLPDRPEGVRDSKNVPIETIVKVIRAGYRLNGDLFRAPQVVVKSA